MLKLHPIILIFKNPRFLFILAILSSCNRPTKSILENESNIDNASEISNNSTIKNDGIIFFSSNNGLTWENQSEGLPENSAMGLGAIATSDTSLAIAVKNSGIYFFDFIDNRWNAIPTDKQILENNISPLIIYKGDIYVGTEQGGIYFTRNRGQSWMNLNKGLNQSPIRRFKEIENKLYVGTNSGFYVYNKSLNEWVLEYGNSTLQVTGITELNGNIFIGSNQGIFEKLKGQENWIPVLKEQPIHNINSIGGTIYAMTYDQLLSSNDNGLTWKNIQQGLPAKLYTFNVIENNNSVFASQWDGVYKKDKIGGNWIAISNGLPPEYAVPNIVSFKGTIIISGSERGLRKGMTTEK